MDVVDVELDVVVLDVVVLDVVLDVVVGGKVTVVEEPIVVVVDDDPSETGVESNACSSSYRLSAPSATAWNPASRAVTRSDAPRAYSTALAPR